MTQAELPNLVGVARQTIAAIETNKHSTSFAVAFRIAHSFGLPIEQVFTRM